MRLYLAGNFPVMKDPVKERDFRDTALDVTDRWRRLLSYFYPNDIKTVIEMRREEIEKKCECGSIDGNPVTVYCPIHKHGKGGDKWK
jgi:hypothetical protein